LPAAEEVERFRPPEDQLQEAAVAVLDREPLGMGDRFLAGPDRLGVGVHAGRLVGEPRQVLHGLEGVVGPGVMVGQAIVDLVEAPGMERLERPARRRVEGPAAGAEEALVGHRLRQGVPEGVLEIGEETALVEELRGLEVG
jgi:hypothetical protein